MRRRYRVGRRRIRRRGVMRRSRGARFGRGGMR